MANGSSDEKQNADELIDRMAPGQVAAVVSLLDAKAVLRDLGL